MTFELDIEERAKAKTEVKPAPGDGVRHRIYCITCRGETNHATHWSRRESGSDQEYQWVSVYRVLVCLGCNAVTFEKSSSNSEDYERDSETGNYGPEVTIQQYPPRTPLVEFLDDTRWQYLPHDVFRMYGEVMGALTTGSLMLTAIGIRALVEAVCRDKGARGRTLEKRIDALVGTGYASTEQARVLHLLRGFGNTAAHEPTPPTRAQVGTLLEILNQVLRTTYKVPWYAKRL